MFHIWSRWEIIEQCACMYRLYIDMVVFIGEVDMVAEIIITLSDYN